MAKRTGPIQWDMTIETAGLADDAGGKLKMQIVVSVTGRTVQNAKNNVRDE